MPEPAASPYQPDQPQQPQQPQQPDQPQQLDRDQVVVALEHLNLLTTKLRDLSIDHTVVDTSDDLGLALLTITQSELAAARAIEEVDKVRKEIQKATEQAAAATAKAAAIGGDLAQGGSDEALKAPYDPYLPPPPPADKHLTMLLWALRWLFKHEYSGWSPTMGKNRTVKNVHGVWEVIHTDKDDPKVPKKIPERPTRAQGPGAGVRVGVLDTGLYPQTWLAGGWTARYRDILSPRDKLTMAQGHATFITGLILEQAPGAIVVVRQVLEKDGATDSWTAAKEIVLLGRSGVDIINLSFACYTDDDEPPLVLATAIDRLDPNIVVVAAAGNSEKIDADGKETRRPNRPAWPAALDDVIAVGAAGSDEHEDDDQPAEFSPKAPWVDLITRGVKLTSTYLYDAVDSKGVVTTYKDGWATWQGTSFASALIAGAIAAGTVPGRLSAASAARDLFPPLDPKQGLIRPQATVAPFVALRIGDRTAPPPEAPR